MYKIALKSLLNIIFAACIFLLFMLPTQLYKFGLASVFGEIFPAIDIMLIYYFSTHKNVKYWMLFLLGFIIDQIYQLPLGTSSLSYILANLTLTYVGKWFILKDYVTNILIFCAYSTFVISFRYLIFIANYKHIFDGTSIYFYYLTTILSYPILKWMIYARPRYS